MSLQICGLNVSSSQKKLQPHGTIDFPCAAYESAHSGNASDIIPWHWHEELEIVYKRRNPETTNSGKRLCSKRR